MEIVLADDELMARIFLKELLREQDKQFDIHITGEAENGEELLSLLERTRPDVVFVDIRMPLGDGLEVIRVANRLYKNIQWVIVSGFSEFTYAREAVRLGVIDYLVKPAESGDLARILKTAENALKARADEESLCWEQAFLESLSADPELDYYDVGIHKKDSQILLCRIDLEGDVSVDLLNGLMGRCREELGVFRRQGYRVIAVPLGSAAILTMCEVTRQEATESRDKAAVRILRFLLQKFLHDNGAVGWSLSCSGFVPSDGFLKAYRRVNRRSWLRCTVGLNREIPCKTSFSDEEIMMELGAAAGRIIDGFGRDLSLPDEKALKYFFSRFADLPAKDGALAFPAIRGYFAFRMKERRGDLESAVDAAALARKLEEIAKNLRRDPHGPDTADRIRMYVNKHYPENIGVNTAADYFGLTPNYISSLFKNRTGTTFVRYLTEKRIQKAKELLFDRPDLSVREIADLTGYSNSRYFSKQFRRYTGFHPSEYRKNA